jgi:pimeloyl-ACP methyl ester carboxylesterase
VRQVEWDIAPETTPEQAQRAVRLLKQAPLEGVRARIHLVVAKSLGTLLLPAAVRLELPGVWLTPLLTDPQVAEAARTAQVPCLLIGGTADPCWRGDVARGGDAEVLELDGAGHLLETGGDTDVSPGALRQVTAAVLAFADRVAAAAVS